MLNAGADPNAKTKSGTTPLHMCIQLGRVKAFQLLLAAGADPTMPDGNGA
jgi:ankyrin repeat protein